MNRYCKIDEVVPVPQPELSCVDQFLNQDFNYNEIGTLRNDIAALVAATSMEEYERIANRLQIINNDDRFSDLSDEDKLKMIPSRYTQDPVELESFTDYLCKAHPELMGVIQAQEKDVKNDPPTEEVETEGE